MALFYDWIESADLARSLDITFGTVLLLTSLFSLALNPLVCYLKLKEQNLPGRLFATTALLDLTLNLLIAPPAVWTLLRQEQVEPVREATTGQVVAALLSSCVMVNEELVLLVLAVTRFLKIRDPFSDVTTRPLLLCLALANLVAAPIYSLNITSFTTTPVYVAVSQAPNSGLEDGRMDKWRLAWICTMSLVVGATLAALVLTVYTLVTHPDCISVQCKKQTKKAVKAMIAMNLLAGLQLLLLVLVYQLHSTRETHRGIYFTLVFLTSTNPSVIAMFNPLLLLMFGYSWSSVVDIVCSKPKGSNNTISHHL